jgi:hypothetical protein
LEDLKLHAHEASSKGDEGKEDVESPLHQNFKKDKAKEDKNDTDPSNKDEGEEETKSFKKGEDENVQESLPHTPPSKNATIEEEPKIGGDENDPESSPQKPPSKKAKVEEEAKQETNLEN